MLLRPVISVSLTSCISLIARHIVEPLKPHPAPNKQLEYALHNLFFGLCFPSCPVPPVVLDFPTLKILCEDRTCALQHAYITAVSYHKLKDRQGPYRELLVLTVDLPPIDSDSDWKPPPTLRSSMPWPYPSPVGYLIVQRMTVGGRAANRSLPAASIFASIPIASLGYHGKDTVTLCRTLEQVELVTGKRRARGLLWSREIAPGLVPLSHLTAAGNIYNVLNPEPHLNTLDTSRDRCSSFVSCLIMLNEVEGRGQGRASHLIPASAPVDAAHHRHAFLELVKAIEGVCNSEDRDVQEQSRLAAKTVRDAVVRSGLAAWVDRTQEGARMRAGAKSAGGAETGDRRTVAEVQAEVHRAQAETERARARVERARAETRKARVTAGRARARVERARAKADRTWARAEKARAEPDRVRVMADRAWIRAAAAWADAATAWAETQEASADAMEAEADATAVWADAVEARADATAVWADAVEARADATAVWADAMGAQVDATAAWAKGAQADATVAVLERLLAELRTPP